MDVDLLAYTDELCTQWKGAADLDLSLAQLGAASYEQHKVPEHASNQGDIQELEQQWMAKRSALQALSTKVVAREKATSALLAGRYQTAFKY